VLDGRYQVIEPIAEGAMGSVYRGERLKLGRAVAIMVMHQELPDELASRERFEREAKLMARLEHPNCVSVIDYGIHEDKPFLVMDLVRGTSLLQLLDKVGRLDVTRTADILKQVLSGLAHAHELGIVHRDIKPANVMISEKAGLGQQVRILDFGLARAIEGSTKLTTGIVVGTPNYMAPEQCKGSDVDARTDLYACGVMLFEMLTGRKPFIADDPIQVVRKHLMEKPPTLASVVPNSDFGEFEAVVAKALAKSPADRFASAVEMAQAIEAAASQATKMSAAALFARAVPEGAPVGSQQATMSGWNVPVEAQASIPLTDSAILPDSAAMAPAQTSAVSADAAAMPPPGADAADDAVPPSGDEAATASPPFAPAESGPTAVSRAHALPPLPQAGPYVPPPPFAAGPASQVPSATTGPAPVAASSGAPDQGMTVPPTRPSTYARAGRPLPVTKKQMMIAGAGLVALVMIVALVAGGGSKQADAPEAGAGSEPAAVDEQPKTELAQVVARASALIASEDYGEAVAVLRRARKANPKSAELAFLSGKANFGRLWWSDGIADFREAIQLDSRYREDPELLKTVLKGFITTPEVDERIVGFMREIGPPLRPYLEETAEKHPKKLIRARARAELDARP
jgi:serine/threonine-protein kinase